MGAQPKIMLVDDDPSIRASIAFALGVDGFDVETYESAEEISARPGLASASCLVIDYRLPGMDGLSLLNLLRERGVTVPAVMITSNPTRLLRQGAAAAGADLVEKPLLGDGLAAAIRSLVAAGKRESGPARSPVKK